jgi:hypothetical protein
MSETNTFKGTCLCGAVEVEVEGPPVAAAICHCESCRRWHTAPLNTWLVWPDAKVSVTAGRDSLARFNRGGTDGPSDRNFCKRCGSAVLNRKPTYGMTVVYATILEKSGLAFQPSFHSFYAEGVMHVADGLPKFADLPAELGGSGKRVDEPARSGMRH